MAITRFTGENLGSLVAIEYIAVQDLESFLSGPGGTIAAAGIVFKSGKDWTPIYCSEDTMGHHQAQVNDDTGQSFAQTVVGFVPGDQPAIESGLLGLQNTRYILRVTRPDGLQKIVGTQLEPLELLQDSDSQTTVPGTAGTALTFGGATIQRALVYTG